MIESVEEYKRWYDRPQSTERWRKLRETASAATWRAIVDQFPECRGEVARNRSLPLEVLGILRYDEDEGVRWRVRFSARWFEHHPEDARPWLDDPEIPIQFRLSSDERRVLRCGLMEWGGPARCTDELALAMGFDGVTDLLTESDRIRAALLAGEPLSRTDWTRALLATEIAFMSGVVGSGWAWPTTTGLDDAETLSIVRRLQDKLVISRVVGTVFGTHSPPTHA